MKVLQEEECRIEAGSKIQVGYASWDDGQNKFISAKYAWLDKRGRACGGGEVPVEALPQMIELAIKSGFLQLSSLAV